MDIDFFAHVEQTLDDYKMRIEALELALTQIPQIDFESDPSRPRGVKVAPAALKGKPVG